MAGGKHWHEAAGTHWIVPLPQAGVATGLVCSLERRFDSRQTHGNSTVARVSFAAANHMSKQGILLMNLGSPDSTAVPDVRKYLKEFLMDGRVLDAPYPIRWFVVNLLILPKRPKESAHAYATIWTKEGSPLVVTSRRVRELLQARVPVPVELCMRYQSPSPETALTSLRKQGVTEVHLIPLFPHYAMSSFETAIVRIQEAVDRSFPGIRLTSESAYYNHPDYIAALVASAADYLKQDYDHLLFSYHGIPERHLRKSDPTGCHCLKAENCCAGEHPAHKFCYRAQCLKTTDLFVKHAGVPAGKWSVSFQSRLGRDPWLKPYTDFELIRFAQEGKKKLLVICPAFVSDCLETIEEIGVRGKESFESAGGTSLKLIPCMNEHPRWIDALEGMARRFGGAAPPQSIAAR
jgi:ferrochelatase